MDKKKIFDTIISGVKVVGPAVLTEKIYESMFGHRFSCFKPFFFTMDDFPKLKRERYTFLSDNHNTLVGYIYKTGSKKGKGLFVFAHGYGGGGHHCYLDLINAICENGYYVFAYDATANDESEGHKIKGFTQGLLDANRAIAFAKSLPEYQTLPLYLCGHSWGAYSMSNALKFHKDVKGLIALSGFNKATSPFEHNGERYAGDKSKEFLVYVETYEHLLFGDICLSTAMDAFKSSKAKIAIVHSEDDPTIPIEAGYDIYHHKYKYDKRFLFKRFNIRGHSTVFYTLNAKKYYDKIHKEYNKFVKEKEPSEEEKIAFLKENIDRNKYNNMVDKELIKELIDFIK